MPASLTRGVREALKGKEGSFHEWKSFTNEENKEENKFCQKKGRKMIQKAKKDFEEHMASNINGNNKSFFK